MYLPPRQPRGAHEDGSAAARRFYRRAEKAQRLRDALHRALREGIVARQPDAYPPARGKPRQKAHGRAAVAAEALRVAEAGNAAHAHLRTAYIHLCAEGAHTRRRGEAVFPQKGVGDQRLPLRRRVEHDGAVGDRFIPGDIESSVKFSARGDVHLFSSRSFRYRAYFSAGRESSAYSPRAFGRRRATSPFAPFFLSRRA